MGSSVLGAVGSHLFPSRTQQLSPPAPKILRTSVLGKIGQGRDLKRLRRESVEVVFLSPVVGRKGRPIQWGMSTDPRLGLRRLAPDPVQFQVILGSLLGDGRIVGGPLDRRLRIAHRPDRAAYVWWKYDRLVALTSAAPAPADGLLAFTTVAHPLFDDLASLPRKRLVELIAPLGLAVWMTDLGRLELRADAFLPAQRHLALAAS